MKFTNKCVYIRASRKQKYHQNSLILILVAYADTSQNSPEKRKEKITLGKQRLHEKKRKHNN